MKDEVRLLNGRWETVGPLAYRGKRGCQDVRCTHFFDQKGRMSEDCIGWHCAYCDQPCSSQGDRCDAAEAVLGESRRVLGEERDADA